jgi:hypothetical protein
MGEISHCIHHFRHNIGREETNFEDLIILKRFSEMWCENIAYVLDKAEDTSQWRALTSTEIKV